MKTNLKILALAAISILSACGGASAPSVTPSSGPGTWPDYSAQVESLDGADPRKFFIANGPALNAVDADGNGLWDDVEERLRTSPVAAATDPRLVALHIRGYQHSLMSRTRAEAAAVFRILEHSTACADYLGKQRGLSLLHINEERRELAREVEAALFVTKQRVLAASYASALASGGHFRAPTPAEEHCNK